jgi:DNA-binding FrmR family transcriptional regulator
MTTLTAVSADGAVEKLAPNGVTPGYAGHKAEQLDRLRKIEGQVRGVTRMVDEDRYCIDVLTQISAVTRALQEVALGLLDDHFPTCVLNATRSDSVDGEARLDELPDAMRRALRV